MRVLLVGLGSIARKHLQVLLELCPDIQVQALRSGARSCPDNLPYNIDNIHSVNDAISPDFVMISNPTAYHYEAAKKVLHFKCPLFIEKPLFHRITEEEKALVQSISDSRIPTYVACNLRFHPAIIFLKSYLKHNVHKIDEVSVYCGSYLPEWRPGVDFRQSYSANAAMGGGVHLDLIHELDYIYYLFGMPSDVCSVKTAGSSLNINAVDSARYLLNYEQFSVLLTLNYFRRKLKRTIEILHDGNILSVDLVNSTVVNETSGETLFEAPSFVMMDTYRAQMNYFLNNFSGTMMNDVQEAFQVLKLALS